MLRKLLEKGAGPGGVLAAQSGLPAIRSHLGRRPRRSRPPAPTVRTIPWRSEPSPFVGERQCTDCHRRRPPWPSGRAGTPRRSPRGNAVAGNPLSGHTPYPDPDDPRVTHSFRLRGRKGSLLKPGRMIECSRAVIDFMHSARPTTTCHSSDVTTMPVRDILRLSRFLTPARIRARYGRRGTPPMPGGGERLPGQAARCCRRGLVSAFSATRRIPEPLIEQTGPRGQRSCHRLRAMPRTGRSSTSKRWPPNSPTWRSFDLAEAHGRGSTPGFSPQCHGHHQELSLTSHRHLLGPVPGDDPSPGAAATPRATARSTA